VQPDSLAMNLEQLKVDFNKLLSNLRASGTIKPM
jgi:hypothetical protein